MTPRYLILCSHLMRVSPNLRQPQFSVYLLLDMIIKILSGLIVIFHWWNHWIVMSTCNLQDFDCTGIIFASYKGLDSISISYFFHSVIYRGFGGGTCAERLWISSRTGEWSDESSLERFSRWYQRRPVFIIAMSRESVLWLRWVG